MISARVRQLDEEGNMLEAIKPYRAETGTDLATAQQRITNLGR